MYCTSIHDHSSYLDLILRCSICNIGTKFYFLVNKSKVNSIDINESQFAKNKFIPKEKDVVLQHCVGFNDNMLAVIKKRKVGTECS